MAAILETAHKRRRSNSKPACSTRSSSKAGSPSRAASMNARSDIISELVSQVMEGTVVMSDNLSATLDARVAELDRMISTQLSAVMHAPEFQKLERSWTGLHYLVKNSSYRLEPADPHAQRDQEGAGQELPVGARIRPERDLQEGLRRGVRHLRRRAVRRPDRRLRDHPPARGHLLPRADVARGRGQPCAVHHAAAPELFGIESYGDLGKPRDLAKVFDTAEYAKWKAFRESEDSRYVGLTLPRFLGRLPFNPADGMTVEGFNFVEDVDGSDHQKYLWCNAAYAFAHAS